MLGHKRMPSREGGVEIVVEQLATRMAALGHDVTLYSRKGHNVAGSEYDDPIFNNDEYFYKGVRVKQVPTLDIKGLAAFTSSYYATKAAIKDKPDVIHFHAEGPCAMIGMAKKAGIRTVATIHGLDWQRAKWGKVGSEYIKHGERVAAKKADEIIVLSENVRNYFRITYGRDTSFIPNGVALSTTVVPNIILDKYRLTTDSYVLYLGRIVPEKGAHYLIDAYKDIKTNRKLVIAGGSSDSQTYFEDLKVLANSDSRIIFTGFVYGSELAELYSNAAVYVLPSDLEGMPISLLEAMSLGCCCLTSDIDECSSVIQSSGKTFKKGNSVSLRKNLTELLHDDYQRKYLGDAAQQRIADYFNWDFVVAKTLDIYEKR